VSRRAAAAACALAALVACAPRAVRRPALASARAPAAPTTTSATASPAVPPFPLSTSAGHDEPALVGVVHVVRRGETVWRIARAYGIDPADLMETNGLSDPRELAEGAELFVPGAERVVEVPGAVATAAATTVSSPGEAVRPESSEERSRVAAPASLAVRGDPSTRSGRAELAWPLRGVLYGRFGVRSGQRHDGIDIAAPEGTPVRAAADGTVIYAGEQAGYGALVIVKHEDGLVTLYAHNSAVLVKDGARVRKGDPVARVGQTGRTTGPHLHFEVRDGTRPKNPLLYLP
jgi:lipoprotein NlpD